MLHSCFKTGIGLQDRQYVMDFLLNMFLFSTFFMINAASILICHLYVAQPFMTPPETTMIYSYIHILTGRSWVVFVGMSYLSDYKHYLKYMFCNNLHGFVLSTPAQVETIGDAYMVVGGFSLSLLPTQSGFVSLPRIS